MFTYWPALGKILRYSLSPRFLRPRSLVFNLIMTLAIFLLRAIVVCFQGLDYLLFPGFTRQQIERPVFIIAPPRSGTTFLHRLLELDPRFTTLKLWQTLLPAISLYKLVAQLDWLDQRVGRPFGRLLDRINEKSFGGWDEIHKTGLERAEEDEQLWVYLFLTPGLMAIYPFIDKLPEALQPDQLPQRVRHRLVRYFRRAMQRHVYATGGRTLLAKNAVAAGRLGIYREALPDMRVIHIVRNPQESIPSSISMFSKPWATHHPQCLEPGRETLNIVDIVCLNYQVMLQHRTGFAASQFMEFPYRRLIKEPLHVVEDIYDHLGMTMSKGFRTELEGQCKIAAGYTSRHSYNLADCGLSTDDLRRRMPEVFAAYHIDG